MIPTTSPVTLEAVMGPIQYLQEQRGLAADIEAGAKGSDPQSVYTPYATALRDDESTFVYGATTWPSLLLMQKEAEAQGEKRINGRHHCRRAARPAGERAPRCGAREWPGARCCRADGAVDRDR